ncbi:DNA-binding protein [Halalkaliarchaeum sp. AArc-GB]|uniref:DNA-binding protein n=1 Tax=Halalkaliarchaeum sp. AArc-GB TaxID=3074078 RepID=UPI00285623F9|nr:DNA-binding protein [Halalkaliarchaeum sp. AArc-GB]MDR5673570.1 DNA-binding protein [Halalkaliarchaeum sp. AArc-GB]
MSSKNAIGNEISVDEQAYKQPGETELDEDGFEVVDETPEFQPTVDMEIQAKVDANHPDGIAQEVDDRIYGVTLAQEERIRAREAELEHISAQAELGTQEGRAKRTRKVVTEQVRRTSRVTVEETGRQDVEPAPDPRERLSQDELATVNQHAQRIVEKVNGGPSRAAIGRLLGERIADGQSTMDAVFDTLERVKLMPSILLEVADVPELPGGEINVEGTVIELWEPSSPAIAQVGLIADDSGKIKFTSWAKSDQPWVKEGDRIQLWEAKKNWYQGRCSLALTYDSRIVFPERERRWWKD